MQDAVYPQPEPIARHDPRPAAGDLPGDQPGREPEAGAGDPLRNDQAGDRSTLAEGAGLISGQTTHEPGALPAESPRIPEWAPSAMMFLGVVLLTWLMFRTFLRRARHASQPSDPRERLESIRRQAGARAQIDSFSADAQELTQRLAAQLDAKAERIQILLAEADEAVRRLERARRGLESASRNQEPRPLHGGHATHDSSLTDPLADPLADKVYRLADEGRSTLEIAQQLNQHVGQIELMLALRRA